MRIARASTAAVLAGLLALTACGVEDADNGDEGDASGTAETAWQEIDACELLSQDQVADLMGDDQPQSKSSDKFNRPTCDWTGAEGFGELRVMLWDPPVDGVANDPKAKRIDVGDDVGRISISGPQNCSMDIETDTAYVQLDLRVPADQLGDEPVCQLAADTGESVIATLGW